MKKYIGLLFVLPFMAACEKNIQVKLPDYQEQLFFFSNAETGSNFSAFVRRSEKITKYNNLHDLSIKNATIMLYINNEPGQAVYYVDSSERYASLAILKPNDKVRVVITAPGYPEAEATAIMPTEVPIESISFIENAKVDKYGEVMSDIKIKFKDPPTPDDYYMVDILPAIADYPAPNQSDTFGYDFLCIKSTDPSIEENTTSDPLSGDENSCLPAEGMLVNDLLFNGQTKEMTFSANSYSLQPVVDTNTGITYYPQIKLKHISVEYYRYLKTTKNVLDNSGNPFAEPVNVKTNIRNGYGVLAPMSVSTKEIKNP
jgi:hypothetical protein